jgi:hypothetical protein
VGFTRRPASWAPEVNQPFERNPHDEHRPQRHEAACADPGREDDLNPERAFQLGLAALELTFTKLVPQLGDPVAVQRKLEYTLAPGLERSVLCYLDLDLETLRPDGEGRLPTVVDYKVKTRPLTQFKADHDFQPAVYLAGRWLEGDPAAGFSFAQIAKPGPRRKEMAASIVTTTRSTGSCAARSRGSPRRPARSSPTTTGSGPTSRGGSPTLAAGSAALATARRGGDVPEVPGCSTGESLAGRRR